MQRLTFTPVSTHDMNFEQQPQEAIQRLVQQARGGEEQAFHTLYKKYNGAMFNTCWRLMNNREEAEDMLQESFSSAFSSLHLYRSEATFGAWLKRIVINRCLNSLNKKGIETQEWNENRAEPIDENSIDESEINLTVARVKEGMKHLSNGYRTVLSLYLLEGYDHTEIAKVLGISESTSKTQYSRAKKKIRELIKAQEDE